jgi:type II secretory pathway component PulF
MQKFRYVAYDSFGRKQSGYVEADSRDMAISLVRRRGLQPTMVLGPYGRTPGAGRFSISRTRVRSLAAYTRKFSQLYNAGIVLDEIFDLLGEEEDVRYLREVSRKLAADVRSGMELEAALKKYPLAFPPLFVALFKTGMESGTLDRVADRLASLYEKESALRIQMATKLTYPVVMLALVLFLSWLMSRFGAMSASLALGLQLFWGCVIILIIFFCTPVGYPVLRAILSHTPFIGSLIVKTNLSRFCRMLALLYGSGIPLLESLDYAQQTLQDPSISRSITRVKALVNEGEDLATAMKVAGMIPARVVSMVAVGEKGGEVEAVLEKMSAYYDIEIDHEQQVLVVVSYFVAYALMAITAFLVILSAWQTYYSNVYGILEW